jgi:hypothetical protein
MMAAAENIADLRSILSIVAEETGALKMEDADEDSVGWTTEGPLPMTFGHVRRAHAALAALEAALSAAEPVSANLNVFVCYDGVIFATENSAKEYCKDRNFALGGMGYNKKPLQGDFTHPAPSVAVKDILAELDNVLVNDEQDRETLAKIRTMVSTLSTQVQDVAESAKEFAASARAMKQLADHGPDDDLRDAMREMSHRMFRVLAGLSPSAIPAAPAKQEGGDVTSK